MSDAADDYRLIVPQEDESGKESRPVRIQYGDVKMDLPRLDDSRQVPMAVLTAGMAAVSRGWDNLEQDEKIGFMATLLAYLFRAYPRLERELDRKSGDKLKDVGLIIGAWSEASKTDLKA